MTDVAFATARQLARMIKSRKIGCEELLELMVRRVRRHDHSINAVVVRRLAAARKTARECDNALRRRGFRPGPLFGIPATIKESFDVAGLPTTWGLTEFAGTRARTNAVVVDRLLAAGVNLFGKSNVPVMLADWQSFNPVYGTTNNPWDLARTPGGSSGGAAAALAAGLTALDYGSDIGASIRNPAHYCGVYGHKPTYGIVSGRGQALPGSVAQPDIAVVGPLARSAFDLETALLATLGPDPVDARGWRVSLPKAGFKSFSGLRVAVMATHPTAEVDDAVQAPILALADTLARLGARVSTSAAPAFDCHEAHSTYIRLLRFATAGRLSERDTRRFMREREGLRARDRSYRAEMVRGVTLSPAEWHALDEARHHMRLAWDAFFRDWDVLLCPTAATTAFPQMQQGERWERMITVNGRPQPSTTQLFWAGFSGVCSLPSTVAPIALAEDGLPVGVQIVGPQYGDLTTLRVAQLIEREIHAFVPPPAFAG